MTDRFHRRSLNATGTGNSIRRVVSVQLLRRRNSPLIRELLASPAIGSDTRRRAAELRRQPASNRSLRVAERGEKSWCHLAGGRSCWSPAGGEASHGGPHTGEIAPDPCYRS